MLGEIENVSLTLNGKDNQTSSFSILKGIMFYWENKFKETVCEVKMFFKHTLPTWIAAFTYIQSYKKVILP